MGGGEGVKYGFVNVGSQKWRRWVTDDIAAAAERKLLVDIHDEYRLTGIQKTYPNLLPMRASGVLSVTAAPSGGWSASIEPDAN